MIRQFIGSVLLAILSTIPVRADAITVTFTSADLQGSPGDTLTLGGELANLGSPVYINSADLNLASFDPSAYAPTDVFSNFILNGPPLADGGSVAFDFYTITIPSGFADGLYPGSLDLLGGATPEDYAPLVSEPFTVQVEPPVTGVPEPGSWILLGTALVGLGAVHRLRRRPRDYRMGARGSDPVIIDLPQ